MTSRAKLNLTGVNAGGPRIKMAVDNVSSEVNAEVNASYVNELSGYFYTLEANARSRYIQKTKLCDGIDPYCLKKSDFCYNHDDFPCVTFPDISNYLVLSTSFYTTQQMKAFKSMEAYNFFVSGWVKDVGFKILKDGSRLVYARVSITSFYLYKKSCLSFTVNCKYSCLLCSIYRLIIRNVHLKPL